MPSDGPYACCEDMRGGFTVMNEGLDICLIPIRGHSEVQRQQGELIASLLNAHQREQADLHRLRSQMLPHPTTSSLTPHRK